MVTGLELTFMGLTRSNCGLFRAPVLIFSPMGKRERREKKKEKGRREKGSRKGKEGRKKK